MAGAVQWPDAQAETITYLLAQLAAEFPGLDARGQRPQATLDAPHVPFLQVELDDTTEDYPVARDNLVRITAWDTDKDKARTLAEAARAVIMDLTGGAHPVLRVVPGENGGGPLDTVDQVSQQPVCSVLVRIHTRPVGV